MRTPELLPHATYYHADICFEYWWIVVRLRMPPWGEALAQLSTDRFIPMSFENK